MTKKIICIFILATIIQGCTYPIYTTKLTQPIEREVVNARYITSIDSNNDEYLTASIGEELFVLNRYTTKDDTVTIIAPTGERFPLRSVWMGTHIYNDGMSGDLIVYTTPDYYKGDIGVILNSNEELATEQPLVQLAGVKSGRRWKIQQNGKFFTIPIANIDSWALRYGGKNDGKYIFEVVNKHESKTTEILQTIHTTERDFVAGIIIRGVLINGVKANKYGVIQYRITDTWKKKSSNEYEE